MRAVIMAGGKGTRLRPVAADIPKPMVSVLGKPVLEYQIESLKKSGITHITLIIGHLGHVIRDYFEDGGKWAVNIDYIQEDRPLGTAGALFYLKDRLKDDFLLVFGDLMLDIDWNSFMNAHKTQNALITLYAHPNSHPYDSDLIVCGKDDRVLWIESKNIERDRCRHNLVNAGIYCVSPKLLDKITSLEKIDLEKHIIAAQVPLGTVSAYRSTEYVKDIGTPERFYSVTEDVRNGIVAVRNLRNRQKAIFLDRDGTINELQGFLRSPDQFKLIPFVAEGIKRANSSRFLTIVATNQPVVARGECTFEELDRIHMKMETLMGREGAYVDDILFCPHHPHRGYKGEIPELKVTCACRKPKTGMLEKAAEKYNIDLSASWYIGDTTVDVQTGINAHMHTILLRTGKAGKDNKYHVKAEYEAADLLDAVEYILRSS